MSKKEVRTGRQGISSSDRMNHSKRIAKGNLEVIKRTCKFCNGQKMFKRSSGLKCTKCQREQHEKRRRN